MNRIYLTIPLFVGYFMLMGIHFPLREGKGGREGVK